MSFLMNMCLLKISIQNMLTLRIVKLLLFNNFTSRSEVGMAILYCPSLHH